MTFFVHLSKVIRWSFEFTCFGFCSSRLGIIIIPGKPLPHIAVTSTHHNQQFHHFFDDNVLAFPKGNINIFFFQDVIVLQILLLLGHLHHCIYLPHLDLTSPVCITPSLCGIACFSTFFINELICIFKPLFDVKYLLLYVHEKVDIFPFQ